MTQDEKTVNDYHFVKCEEIECETKPLHFFLYDGENRIFETPIPSLEWATEAISLCNIEDGVLRSQLLSTLKEQGLPESINPEDLKLLFIDQAEIQDSQDPKNNSVLAILNTNMGQISIAGGLAAVSRAVALLSVYNLIQKFDSVIGTEEEPLGIGDKEFGYGKNPDSNENKNID